MKQVVALCIVAVLGPAAAASGAPCESLASLSLPNTTVTLAQTVAHGAFMQPDGRSSTAAQGAARGAANAFASLPPFCRVAVTLTPTPRSDIKAEVWLPSNGWNGKLQVVGNGSFAGTIGYAAMATALAGGYAAASTDTGHTGAAANTFVNDDVLVDYAYRSIHETTAAAKKIVDGFYGSAPKFSYFSGCSTGGRQALHEAQRYPDDFDGIVAGAPGLYASRQAFAQNWMYQATADAKGALPREALTLVHDAVLNACDGLDGARDGILENPLVCQFDPQVLTCRAGSAASCLTPPQVAAVKKIYAGPSNPRTGEQIFPGLERGSELGWSPGPLGLAADYFKFIVFKDPNWDPRTLNFDADVALVASRSDYQPLDARTADLGAFAKRGGKLLMYQGWAENGIPPRNVVSYYAEVKAKTANAADSVRLFMVPGMGHCGGGDGATTFDMVAALDRWVTSGTAPAVIPASRVRPSTDAQGVPSGVEGRDGKTDRTRPLCAYPQFAVYKGVGSINDAASFECRANPTR